MRIDSIDFGPPGGVELPVWGSLPQPSIRARAFSITNVAMELVF